MSTCGRITVKTVLETLNWITGGRMIIGLGDFSNNPYLITKSSNIPGKSIMEIPGLIYGSLDAEVAKIGVCLTLSECHIELAGAEDIDLLIVHHPVADAANCGGSTIKDYFHTYGMALIEIHEPLHGLHSGMAYLHGFKHYDIDMAYRGVPGKIVNLVKPLPEIKTAGDVIDRLNRFSGRQIEEAVLEAEKRIRDNKQIKTDILSASPYILNGSRDDRVEHVLMISPHGGADCQDLENLKKEHPELDTVIFNISRCKTGSDLALKCRELNLTVIIGNSHVFEVMENGLPLAIALEEMLPETEVYLLRERVSMMPAQRAAHADLAAYGRMIAAENLIPEVNKPR